MTIRKLEMRPLPVASSRGWGWADPASDCPVHGFTGDGLKGGPFVINSTNNNELWSFHVGGIDAVFCDRGVRLLADAHGNQVITAMVTRAGRDGL